MPGWAAWWVGVLRPARPRAAVRAVSGLGPLAVPARWRRGGCILHSQRAGHRNVARGFRLPCPAVPDCPDSADLSRLPGGVRAVPDGAAIGHRLRAHALAWPRQSGALHLVRWSAEELGHRHHHTPDDDARLVPEQCVAGCLGRVPRCRVESFDRMAVLSVRAADWRTTGTDANGLDFLGSVAGSTRMAGSGARGMAVQSRISPEQGAVLRVGDSQCKRDPRGSDGPASLPRRAGSHSCGQLTGRRYRQVVATGGVDRMSCGATHDVIHADRGITSRGS